MITRKHLKQPRAKKIFLFSIHRSACIIIFHCRFLMISKNISSLVSGMFGCGDYRLFNRIQVDDLTKFGSQQAGKKLKVFNDSSRMTKLK